MDERTDDMNARINVTAYSDLTGKVAGTLYDGDMHFRGGWYSLTEGDRAKDGFLRNLNDVAAEAEVVLLKETENVEAFRKHDIHINYESRPEEESTFGQMGYSSSTGAYSRRPLTPSEMNSLIIALHKKVMKSIYKKK